MNKQTEDALRMAIEALYEAQTIDDSQYKWERNSKAINACKAALQEDALDRMAENARELGLEYDVKCSEHPDAPHGFCRNASHSAGRYVCECEGWEAERKLSEQKPVAWEWFEDRAYYDMYAVRQIGNRNFDEVIHVLKSKDAKYLCDWLNSLNTHPAQPLSDDEIEEVFNLGHRTFKEFARAIEAAHGIGE